MSCSQRALVDTERRAHQKQYAQDYPRLGRSTFLSSANPCLQAFLIHAFPFRFIVEKAGKSSTAEATTTTATEEAAEQAFYLHPRVEGYHQEIEVFALAQKHLEESAPHHAS